MAPKPAIGQRWRTEDGYLVRVIAINNKGWPFVRHVNAKQGGMNINPAWFSTKPEDGGMVYLDADS